MVLLWCGGLRSSPAPPGARRPGPARAVAGPRTVEHVGHPARRGRSPPRHLVSPREAVELEVDDEVLEIVASLLPSSAARARRSSSRTRELLLACEQLALGWVGGKCRSEGSPVVAGLRRGARRDRGMT